MTQQLVKKGQQISLKIKRLGINGEGIGYYKKLIILERFLFNNLLIKYRQ